MKYIIENGRKCYLNELHPGCNISTREVLKRRQLIIDFYIKRGKNPPTKDKIFKE